MFRYAQKENVDYLLRLRIPRYWGNLYCLNEQMPTPNGVNYLLQFLQYSSNSPIIGIQESKVDVLSYVLCFYLSS